MSDYRAAIERDGCEHSCNTSKICVCAMIEDANDEIERLREALLRTNDHAGAMADQARKLHRVEIIVQAEEGTQAERYERIKSLVMEQE